MHHLCWNHLSLIEQAIADNYGVSVSTDKDKTVPDPDVYFSPAHVLRAAQQPR
jgi:hypothetical protein